MTRRMTGTSIADPRNRGDVSMRLHAQLSRLVSRPLFWAAVIVLGLLVPVLNQVLRPPPPPLPVLGQLGAFSFVDQEGRSFGSEDLKGHVWSPASSSPAAPPSAQQSRTSWASCKSGHAT